MSSNELAIPARPVTVFDASERIPLGTTSAADMTGTRASGPFGLRFMRPLPGGKPVAPSRLCPDRQIAVTLDGEGVPWYRVVSTSMTSTGPSTDGQGSTGGEEWTPDQGRLG